MIELEIEFTYVIILINKLPHLVFKRSEFMGLQSWVEGKNRFIIELYFINSIPITSEYTDKDKFKSILNLLYDNLPKITINTIY